MSDPLAREYEAMAARAREAARVLGLSTDAQRNGGILAAAAALVDGAPALLEVNGADMDEAAENGASAAMLDRLKLTRERIEGMARGMEAVAAQPDPLAAVDAGLERPNGLKIRRVPVPLGVIGMIYESRPNVAADAAALCVKAGNAVILRGGSDSARSSRGIVKVIRVAFAGAGLPEDAVQAVGTQDRAMVGLMLATPGAVDVIIPRGGKGLTERVQKESRVPTLLHLDGNCHVYLHEKADAAMALAIVENAKLRRTGICGAMESLLVDAKVAEVLLPPILERLIERGCEVRGDLAVRMLDGRVIAATDEDWGTEYLAPALSVKVVGGIDEAIGHINRYGSHHTDAIVTGDEAAAKRFIAEVDSAIVMHNASTQFADGGEFGFGGEIGIATGRLHARGPVGAAQLVTYKYAVEGDGQVRA